MGEAPLSLHLDAATREALEREARLLDVSEADVAKQLIETFLDAQVRKRGVIATAVEEAKKGVFISAEAMLDWVDRLEADPDVPPPEPDVLLPPRA